MTFRKNDSGKPRMDLIPHEALIGVAEVMTHGATKYDSHNWRQSPPQSRLYSAAMRHMTAYQTGSDIDDDSGLHHIDHAAANLMMLSSSIRAGILVDDRPSAVPRLDAAGDIAMADDALAEMRAGSGPVEAWMTQECADDHAWLKSSHCGDGE